jgi:HPt (histidine-containing phosphotransfer) domain-containing protein
MSSSRYLHIDPRVLLDAADGDTAVFCDLCRTFLEIAPTLMRNLENAVREQDRAATMRHSHSLKGTVALVGAKELAALLQAIETAANGADTPIPDQAASTLLFQSVMQEVQECMRVTAAGGMLLPRPETDA